MLLRMGGLTALAFALLVGGASAATIKVTTTIDELNDDGDCSLREAVQAANTNSAVSGCEKGQGGSKRDTIKLKAADYTNGVTSTNEGSNADGDFDVTGGGPVTILGKGPQNTDINDGTDEDRLFDLTAGSSNLTLDGVGVAGGDVLLLPLFDATGGDIRALDGKLVVRNAEVTSGDAVIGGGLAVLGDARATISNTLFSSNDATSSGGSLALRSDARATVKRTTFQVSNVTSSVESIEGGIIDAEGEKLTILDSTLQGSSAETTGAAHAAFGGGIYVNSDVVIKRSLLQGLNTHAEEDNVGEHGGGIFVGGGNLDVVNSTIFNTHAGQAGGDNDGSGGAIFVADGSAAVTHVTFDSTDATSVGDALGATSGTLGFRHSLIHDAEDPCSGSPVFSSSYNVSEDDDADCDFNDTDAPDAITALGSLSENGGPTLTIPITNSSTAKNFVPKGACKQYSGLEDQRKFVRPKGKKCDAGAFELGATKK